jgi:hypothetical protein
MSEKEKPFTVNDRRHFTPEGRAREEADAGATAAGATAAEGSAGVATGAPVAQGSREVPRSREPRAAEGPSGPVDLSQFLLSLGTQAGMMLAAEPGSEGEREALEGARQIISILEMLQGKTEERRTEEETRVLEGLLFQLRLAYVERAKRS